MCECWSDFGFPLQLFFLCVCVSVCLFLDLLILKYIFFFSSWLDFVNEDLWRRLYMSTAGMLMAD